MSFLSQVTKGLVESPHLILIYGTDGIGKSTFASEAPSPVFLGGEEGTKRLDVARLPAPNTYDDVLVQLKELTNDTHNYRTLVVDSVDWLEPLIWEYICKKEGVSSLEKVGGGYGKGYTEAQLTWRDFCKKLQELQSKTGMHVILVGHSFIKPFHDPEVNVSYDRYIIKMHDKSASILREFVDAVLFANFETIAKEGEGIKKAKAYGDGTRVLYTERRPAFDAKNRLGLPFQMELSWGTFEKFASSAGPETNSDSLKNQILDHVQNEKSPLSPALKDKARSALAKAGSDAVKLKKVLNTINTIIGA